VEFLTVIKFFVVLVSEEVLIFSKNGLIWIARSIFLQLNYCEARVRAISPRVYAYSY